MNGLRNLHYPYVVVALCVWSCSPSEFDIAIASGEGEQDGSVLEGMQGAAADPTAAADAAGVASDGTVAADSPQGGAAPTPTGIAGDPPPMPAAMEPAPAADPATDAQGTDAPLPTSGAEAGASSSVDASLPAEFGCFAEVSDLMGQGPFAHEAVKRDMVEMWVPALPAGCKAPLIHFANGTGGTCATYRPLLTHLASHGFLVACYESTNTGAGTQGVMALGTALAAYPQLVAPAIGSMGHSQGGQAAFVTLQLAEDKWGDAYTYAGLAMEPASGFGTQPTGGWQAVYGKVKSPMFMFSGSADAQVSADWVQRGFDALDASVEAYHWSAQGATHIPVPNLETMDVAIPWFRWKLLGDNNACTVFKELKSGSRWSEVASRNSEPCK